MTETIEIEFKNMLKKSEYEFLLKVFKVEEKDIISQVNHYFDTPNFELKALGAALRIREKNNKFEMTLKQPATVGLLETTQHISTNEVQTAIQQGTIPKGMIQERMELLNISLNSIEYFGSLTTRRVEFPYNHGLLVLDHSLYLNTEDYELEYEVKDYESGQLAFQELLMEYEIPQRATQNKITRFYQQKNISGLFEI